REPAFEAQAVDEHELGIGNLLGVARRWRVDMGIAAGPDQRRDLDAVAAHVLHKIAQDREAGDDLHSILPARRRGNKDRAARARAKRLSAGHHGTIIPIGPHRHAWRWRPGNAWRTSRPTRPNSNEVR